MPTAALCSFRLGGTDGVSVVAGSWARALTELGFTVVTVAGSGQVDRPVAGLALGAETAPAADDVEAALADADVVVVENLLSIPMNLPASRVVAATVRGRPSVLHHHDPPWQRPEHAHVTELPPDDPAWAHVTINDLTRAELAARGIDAVTIRNGFDLHEPAGDRTATRRALGVDDDELLLAHPVRAIARKDVPAAVALAEALHREPPEPWRSATYWLWGPAEDGYGPVLDTVLAGARCRVIHRSPPGLRADTRIGGHADAYAAADAVLFPSTWEGFGNPPVEAAIHRRPCAVGRYPVAEELRALGLRWFPSDEPESLRAFLAAPDDTLLEANRAVVSRHLSQANVVAALADLLRARDWLPPARPGRLVG